MSSLLHPRKPRQARQRLPWQRHCQCRKAVKNEKSNAFVTSQKRIDNKQSTVNSKTAVICTPSIFKRLIPKQLNLNCKSIMTLGLHID